MVNRPAATRQLLLTGSRKYSSDTASGRLVKGWLQSLGVSQYGQSDLYEVIAEVHAQYALGESTPLTEAMGEAMGWTK